MTKLIIAGFVEEEGNVAALEEGVGWGFDAGCEHAKGVFVYETAEDAKVCLGVCGANIHHDGLC